MSGGRFVCVHGHFYQPPREDPWTGEIERQPSAGEDHDWNRRVARECYIPNGAPANNYAWMSFNFGPTLLSWLEKASPEAYARLLEADRDSARRLGGHGNAIAQAYGHAILPLSCWRDRLTQIRWGVADFTRRFGRTPEALWLPETACDDGTLRALIACGLKYAILAPSQARRVRALEHSVWRDVSDGGVDAARPYRWFDTASEGPASIDLFFYDGGLSHAVAFEGLLKSSAECARRVEAAFVPPGPADRLVSICTDGETYGHHQKFADLGLAHLLGQELPERGLSPVNYGWFLERRPPEFEVELASGPQGLGTSWSCAHGVGRWLEDCGCGAEPGRHQRWRRPLREAIDWLNERLSEVYERQAGDSLKDVWDARDAYVAVILDPGERSEAAFFSAHGRGRPAAAARRKALRLLEMQRHALLMQTSCGWFFSDIAGLEAVQNLKHAARAIELAAGESAGLEAGFLSRLAAAPGNLPELPDGAAVYRSLARPETARFL